MGNCTLTITSTCFSLCLFFACSSLSSFLHYGKTKYLKGVPIFFFTFSAQESQRLTYGVIMGYCCYCIFVESGNLLYYYSFGIGYQSVLSPISKKVNLAITFLKPFFLPCQHFFPFLLKPIFQVRQRRSMKSNVVLDFARFEAHSLKLRKVW